MDHFREISTRLLLLGATLLATPFLTQAATPQRTYISGEVGVIGGSVSRSAFTEAVVNREPKTRLSELTNNRQFIYYFSELKGMAGQTITHRWIHGDTVMAETKFSVGSPRWRVWSSFTLNSEWLGKWQVQVVDEMGQVVHSDSFNYVQATTLPGK